MQHVLLLILILIGTPAEAALMQVVAVGYDPYYSDPDGLLPFPAPPANSAMTITFTYESDALDVAPDPDAGIFAGAITGMTLSISGVTLSALPQNQVAVLNDQDQGDGSFADIWFAVTSLDEGSIRTEMSLSLPRSGGGAINSDALSPPTFPVPWNWGFIYYGIRDRSDPDASNWITLAEAQVPVASVTVTTVPIPPAGLLLVSGLLTLAGFRSQGRA